MAVGTPRLGDGVVRLRPFLADDADVHLAGEGEDTVRFLSGGTSTLAGTQAWIATHRAGWETGGPALVLAVEEIASGHLAGVVEARFDVAPADGAAIGAANLSYGLYPAARGRGLATRSIRLLLGELARRGVAEAVIRVDPANPASLRLARRLGFHEVEPVTTTSGERLQVFRTVIEPVDTDPTTIRTATADDLDATAALEEGPAGGRLGIDFGTARAVFSEVCRPCLTCPDGRPLPRSAARHTARWRCR